MLADRKGTRAEVAFEGGFLGDAALDLIELSSILDATPTCYFAVLEANVGAKSSGQLAWNVGGRRGVKSVPASHGAPSFDERTLLAAGVGAKSAAMLALAFPERPEPAQSPRR